IRDDALVLDMSALNSISVDVDNMTAVVGPGVKSRDLAAHLAEFNLAFPVGHCGGVAMGGFLLGGGIGINWTGWGPSSFLLKGIDVIGSDGVVRHVDDTSEPDLMWLARGCGPSFPGVITGYHIDLKPEPVVAQSTYLFPAERMSEVTTWLDGQRDAIRPTVEVLVTLVGAFACELMGLEVPHDSRYVIVVATAYESSVEEAEIALRPLNAGPVHSSALVADHATPALFKDLPAWFDALWPDGLRLYADTAWTDEDVSNSVGLLEEHVKSCPSDRTVVLGVLASGLPLPGDANFSMVRKTLVILYAFYETAEEDTRCTAWVKQAMHILSPVTKGHWLGESNLSSHPSRARKSFAPENWTKARKIRAAYDPDHRFADYILADYNHTS
ncbi:MAG TPA: FAD-binding protein, partial [Mycobacterium sp.]